MKNTKGNDKAFEEILFLSYNAKERGIIDEYKVYNWYTVVVIVFTMKVNGKPFTTIITKDENENVVARNYNMD